MTPFWTPFDTLNILIPDPQNLEMVEMSYPFIPTSYLFIVDLTNTDGMHTSNNSTCT